MGAAGDFNWAMLVHGEQAIELHAPIPTEGRISTVAEISAIWDKGKAAVVETTNVSTDLATGKPLFSARSASFIRGEGGFGGDRRAFPRKPRNRRTGARNQQQHGSDRSGTGAQRSNVRTHAPLSEFDDFASEANSRR